MDINTKIKDIMDNPAARVTIIVVLSIITVFVLLGIADTALFSGKVHKGVKVDGVDVGGMSEKEASSKVGKLADVLQKRIVIIKYKNRVWKLDFQDIKVQIDTEKTIENALSKGRQGGIIKSIRGKISLWFKPVDISPVFTYDTEGLDRFINKITKAVNVSAEDAQIKIVDGRVAVSADEDGRKVDKESLIKQIKKAMIARNVNELILPVNVSKPDITKDHIDAAKNTVTAMVKYPITLKYQESTWSISVQRIGDWINFIKTREGTHWSLSAALDKDEVKKYLEDITKSIVTEPKDAQFKVGSDDKVTIIPSSDGIKVDLDKAFNDILTVSKDSDNREVLLSTVVAKAKLSTEDASKMGIKEKVTSFTTFFNPAQAPRVHNIQLLGSALDGSIIAPKEVFSFNKTIGPRTAEKGYQEAPAIMNGKLVPELGGGVCQVGTTLFNAIFFGGYDVVERHNHSFYISHYPLGRDATVSWGGPDLKFKNDSPSYILIKVYTTASSITISFYSTSQNVKVDYTTEGPSNFKDLSPQTIQDPTLPQGTTKQEEGFSGRDVTVYRTVSKNGVVVRKDKFFSRYVPKRAVIRVGAGPVAVESSPTANIAH